MNIITSLTIPEKIMIYPDTEYKLANLKVTLRAYKHLFNVEPDIRIAGNFYTTDDAIDPVCAPRGVKVIASLEEILASRKLIRISVDGKACYLDIATQAESEGISVIILE